MDELDGLRAEVRRMEIAAEVTGACIWDWRIDTGRLDVNEGWARSIGYERRELEPITFELWRSLVHPDDFEMANEALAKHTRGDSDMYSCEYRMRRRDGPWIWFLDQGQVTERGEGGKPVRMTGVRVRIEEKKLGEAERDRERGLFKSIMGTVPVGITIIDPAGLVTYANQRAVEILGLERNDDAHKPYNDPEWRITDYEGNPFPDGKLPFRRVMETQRSVFGVEHAIRWPGGRFAYLSVNASPLFDEAGLIQGVVASIEDVTGKKRAEEASIKSEDRYRSLFIKMKEGFALHEIILGADGRPADYRFLSMNPAFEALTGLKADDTIGKRVLDIIPGLEPAWIERYGRIAMGGVPEEFEDYVADLKRTYHVLAYSPGPGYFATLVADVTEKKMMEEQLERGQRLESLGILAGGIAHDFNNLLAGLFGYTEQAREILEKADAGPGSREMRAKAALDKAIGIFDRAKGLTRQLLTFAKGGEPVMARTDLGALLMKSVEFALSGSKATARFEVPPGLWPVECDETQIGQSIDNIVINSVQAMPNGGLLRVAADNIPREGLGDRDMVRVSIQDQGLGMAPDVLEHAFDPFFTTKANGQGLGLAMVHSIIKRHGGEISIHSGMGEGTTIDFSLPAACAEPESGREPESASDSAPAGTGKVLILDDEAFMREILSGIFQEMGYAVESASNGEEALRLFEKTLASGEPYAVCILDLTIPGGMGGRETCARMRLMRRDSAIVATSGYSDDQVMSRPREFGFSDSIRKPFLEKDVRALMRRLRP